MSLEFVWRGILRPSGFALVCRLWVWFGLAGLGSAWVWPQVWVSVCLLSCVWPRSQRIGPHALEMFPSDCLQDAIATNRHTRAHPPFPPPPSLCFSQGSLLSFLIHLSFFQSLITFLTLTHSSPGSPSSIFLLNLITFGYNHNVALRTAS